MRDTLNPGSRWRVLVNLVDSVAINSSQISLPQPPDLIPNNKITAGRMLCKEKQQETTDHQAMPKPTHEAVTVVIVSLLGYK